MALRYRNAKGQFVKAGAPGAQVTGYQKGRKIVPLEIDKVKVSADARGGKRKPTAVYRSNGRIIPRKIAEEIFKTDQFKKMEKDKAKRFREQAKAAGEIAESVPFFELADTFKEAFSDVFGFQSLTIKEPTPPPGSGGTRTQTFTSLKQAREYLRKKTYQAGELTEEANETEAGTPNQVFDIPIFMNPDRPGVYFIQFKF